MVEDTDDVIGRFRQVKAVSLSGCNEIFIEDRFIVEDINGVCVLVCVQELRHLMKKGTRIYKDFLLGEVIFFIEQWKEKQSLVRNPVDPTQSNG